MRVLVIGGGAREHALAWRIAGDAQVSGVIVAPGNPGIAALTRVVGVRPEVDDLLALAERE